MKLLRSIWRYIDMNIERMKRMFGPDYEAPNPQVPSNVVVLEDLGDSLLIAVKNPDKHKGVFCDNKIIG